MGFSTLIAILMFIDTMNNANTQSIMIAQDEENSKRLFQMILRLYENLAPHKKRVAKNDSSTNIYWDDIDSRFYVGWAGSKKLGRSGTYNNIHASEISRWENAGELVAGLFQAVPEDGNIFLESTAAGVDNYYYLEYQAAVSGVSVYTPRFYPWFIDPEYVARELIHGGIFEPTSEEIKLAERFNLTTEQLIWRRNKILELRNAFLGGNEAGTFQQEYPSTADEAFLTTGVSYFDKEFIIQELIPETIPPLGSEAPRNAPTLARVAYQDAGRFFYWKKPEAGHRYIVACDPSGGVNTSGQEDFSSADVIDVETWEQVAVLHGRWEPDELGHILSEIGHWYNHALIGVLSMNHGHSVLNTLINSIGYESMNGYGGVYYYKDVLNKKNKPVPGFPENVKTKPMMLSALAESVQSKALKINSKETLKEMTLFSKLPGYKLGALIGHDDRVSSAGLAAFILKDVAYQSRVLSKRDNRKIGKIQTKRKTGML